MHFAMTAKSLGVSSSSCMPTKWCKKRVVLAVSRTWRRGWQGTYLVSSHWAHMAWRVSGE